MTYTESLIDEKTISLDHKLKLMHKKVGKDTFYHLAIFDPKTNEIETILSTSCEKVAKDKFRFVYEQTKPLK